MKIVRFLACFLFSLLFMIYFFRSEAQTRQIELLKGIKISASIKPGEKKQYTVNLKENQIEFVRDGEKKIIGYRVSSGRVRNLGFEKVKN
jgi:hypothetical protein